MVGWVMFLIIHIVENMITLFGKKQKNNLFYPILQNGLIMTR